MKLGAQANHSQTGILKKCDHYWDSGGLAEACCTGDHHLAEGDRSGREERVSRDLSLYTLHSSKKPRSRKGSQEDTNPADQDTKRIKS